MERTVEAMYENGVLTPLEPLDLPNRQRVTISIQSLDDEADFDGLAAWHRVYEGLPENELGAIERIALDRTAFMRPAA
jgi:predicted DNA-binding antitoxin AbrB/MazE fold protein